MKSLTVFALVAVYILLPRPLEAAVTPVVAGLDNPVRVTAPNGDSRLFVVERPGRIRVFDLDGTSRGVFLDIASQVSSGGERGLLGLAFPPDYAVSGRFYVNFTNANGDTRIDRFSVDPGDPDRALASSQENLLVIAQPASNHNGGELAFGPDGMLFVGMGDGGSSDNAQDDQTLLGKMLRLDVSPASGYAVPADNPFVATAPLDEIWALGLRNPWCFSFDRMTGDLYIADVGQSTLEEIDILAVDDDSGQNLGWSLMEGDACYSPSSGCNDGSLMMPVYTYTHGGSPYRCSISGGLVYRGDAVPSLQGRYLFSDYCSGQIWAMTWTPDQGVTAVDDLTDELGPVGGYDSVVAFGQDGHDEMYIVDMGAGTVYGLEGASPVIPGAGGPVLEQNVPNPFNPSTRIDYRLAEAGHVTLQILDLAGHRLATLVAAEQPEGPHRVFWDGTDDGGRRLGAGIYLYRLEAAQQVVTRKVVLVE